MVMYVNIMLICRIVLWHMLHRRPDGGTDMRFTGFPFSIMIKANR